MKKLSVKSFLDGYSVKYLPCDDLLAATFAGYYKEDYYYDYCFIRACMITWNGFEPGEEYKGVNRYRKFILNELGLDLVFEQARTKEEFISLFENKIEQEIPVEMLVKLQSMFYRKYSKKNEQASYSIMLTGCDKEHRLAMIQDNTITRWNLQHTFRGEMFCRLQITYELLEEMFEKSAQMFAEQNNWKNYCIYTVQKRQEKEFDALDYFLKRVQQGKMQETIKSYNKLIVENGIGSEDAYMEYFLKQYHLAVEVVLERFERYFEQISIEALDSYRKIKNDYFAKRKGIVFYVAREILRRHSFSEDKLEELLNEIDQLDFALLNGLKKLQTEWCKEVSVND